MDKAADEVWGKIDDEEDNTNSAKAAPRFHDLEVGMSASVAAAWVPGRPPLFPSA